MNFSEVLSSLSNKWKSRDVKILVNNFFSLSILNVLNYLFPIILVPFLTRKLGVEGYGLYVFSYSIQNYFVLIVHYGFHLSATKQIAHVKESKIKVDKLFSSVLSARLLLSIVSIALLTCLVFAVPKFSEDRLLYFYGIGIFIGTAITPTWFFLGMERMKFIVITNFFIRIVLLILLIIFIRNETDYRLAILFNSISFMIGGLIGLFISFKIFCVNFRLPSKKELTDQFTKGWHLFLSTIGMNFYRESNIVILGFITNYNNVGIYAAAEKLIKAIQSVTIPVVNTLYPFFGRKLNDKKDEKAFPIFIKISKYYILVLFLITTFSFFFSGLIIEILGEQYKDSLLLFRILCIIILVGGSNYFYGMLGLVNLNKEKSFTKFVWISGTIGVASCVILSHFFEGIGTSVSVVIAEFSLLILISNSLIKYRTLKIKLNS